MTSHAQTRLRRKIDVYLDRSRHLSRPLSRHAQHHRIAHAPMPALSLRPNGDTLNTESSMSKKTLSRSRQSAYIAQGGKCYYCGYAMWLLSRVEVTQPYGITKKQANRLKCTAEYLIPRSEGGNDLPANIVAACLHCNTTRHKQKTPLNADNYLGMVRSRIVKGSWHLAEIVKAMYTPQSAAH